MRSSNKGFTLIELMIVIAIIAIIAAIAIPNLIQARKHGNEASAIGALKTIATSQAIFREGDKEQDGNLDYGMLSEMNNTKLIDSVLGSGTKQGYLFQGCYSYTTSEFLWFSLANPAIAGTTGDRYFDTNQAGVIFYSTQNNLALDTDTCSLPNNGVIPTGK
ncbi:MAG: prepilin-type N-terminal cleavage/methylation domain-containing protein [Planctomycetota bacterium]